MNEHSENEQFARLGYERVALVEQEGIESFSNTHGLQVIRFPRPKNRSGVLRTRQNVGSRRTHQAGSQRDLTYDR
jgi:hypothetical protein